MAAASAILGGASAGMGLISGGIQAIQGARDRKKYQRLLDNYQRQTLTNPYENLRVSTMGAMQQQESAAQNTASALYNLRRSGANAILGGTGNVLRQNNLVNQQIAAGLDQQQIRNDQLRAQGEGMVQQMQERREEQDLAGLGQALNVSNQNIWGGLDTGIGSLSSLGGMFGQIETNDMLRNIYGAQNI